MVYSLIYIQYLNFFLRFRPKRDQGKPTFLYILSMVYSYIYIQYLNFFSIISGRREIRRRLRIYISPHQENVADHIKTLKTSRMPRKKYFLVSVYRKICIGK